MNRKSRTVLPVLALAAFWLSVLVPFIQPGQMTCSHDGLLHWLRAFQLDELVRQGILWPRWAPGLVLGYGYPLFNFYPALALYPLVILHRLGLTLLASWNTTLALSVLASGATMYLWARQMMRPLAAFVAAVAYMLAPYQLYDVYWRGTLTESLTLPLLPLGLWAALRTVQTRRWRDVAPGALVCAAFLLTHAPASLIFSMVLASYAAMLILTTQERRGALTRLIGLAALGGGLALFVLAPAFLERDQVQFTRAITLGEGNFANNFLAPGELIGPLRASDPLLINPPPTARSLGWALSGLAILGALAAWLARASRSLKPHVVWAVTLLIGTILMTLPISRVIWSNMPFLPYVQLPWRFLGPASLLAAFLAGVGVEGLAGHHSRMCQVWTGVCLAMLVIQTVPWAYPRLCSVPDNPDWAFSVNYEEQSGFLGTTTLGEYLPVAVHEVPKTWPMAQALREGRPVVRWHAPGARVVSASDTGLSAALTLESDAPLEVVYRSFYFPGWRATLDGRPVELKVSSPWGLMAIDVPAGRHTLTVQFGSTPVRTVSEILSCLVALGVVVLWILDPHPHQPAPLSRSQDSPVPSAWLGLMALGLALSTLKAGVIDRFDTPLRWSRLKNNQIADITSSSDVVIAAKARLLGYELRSSRPTAGQVVYVDLYWTLQEPLDFLTSVRLLDERGLIWSLESKWDKATLKGYNPAPSSREWPMGQYAQDRYAINILPGTPPGSYSLVVVPFKPDTSELLPSSGGQPAPGGQAGVAIGKMQVSAPAQPPSVDALEVAVRTDAPMGTDLALIGYSLDRGQAEPGQTMLLTLGWQARARPSRDYSAHLELIAPEGQVIARQSFAPGGDQYPTSRWRAGEIIRSQVLAHIPGRAATGPYIWRVTLLDENSSAVGQADLASLQINAPRRVFGPPLLAHPLGARLGDPFILTGWDAPARVAPGQTLSVTLVWQSAHETDRDYKVFVHLLDDQGHILTQSDAVPDHWTRPTSGWQPGEYVSDIHRLALQPNLAEGQYRLLAGMYDAETGQRLRTDSGADVIELGQLEVSINSP